MQIKLCCFLCFCSKIQKPCGCIINNCQAELYWMLKFHFHTSHAKRLAVVVMTQDIFVSLKQKRNIFKNYDAILPQIIKTKTECIWLISSMFRSESFLIKKCFCFEKENNAILTRDKLFDAYIMFLWFMVIYFPFAQIVVDSVVELDKKAVCI